MSGPPDLRRLVWPAAGWDAAVAAAAAAGELAGDGAVDGEGARAGAGPDGGAGAGGISGIDVDEVEIAWPDLDRALAGLGPAVVRMAGCAAGYLVLAGGRGGCVLVRSPDGRRHRMRGARIAAALRGAAADGHAAEVDGLLAPLGLARRRRVRARQALLAARLSAVPGITAWTLSGGGGRRLGAQLGRAHWTRAAAALAVAVAASQALALGGWVVLGRGLLGGGLASGWRLAWGLLVLTLPLARGAEIGAAMSLGRGTALVMRRRLLAHLLAVSPERLRGEGTGRLLGRLLSAEALERLPIAAACGGLVGAGELAGAVVALASGAAAALHVALLMLALAAAALLWRRQARAQDACAAQRRELTDRLVEALAGHRTRRVQGGAEPDPGEDAEMAAHHRLVRRLGGNEMALRGALARAWMIAGLGALAPAVLGGAAGAGRLAASLGGLLLAQAALGRVGAALCDLAAARAAGREVAAILAGGADGTGAGAGEEGAAAGGSGGGERRQAAPVGAGLEGNRQVVEAREIGLRPPGALRPVLAGVTVEIGGGDRLVLEGPSGGGKSTLAAVLAAQRGADSGLLLLDGLDLPTLGRAAWRRRVVAVPQLHANHIFAGTLAFNLLLGRGWPPAGRDLADAGDVCRELGLGELLERLPGGLEQRIGEAGWRLSDGEASRVCLARGLLQDPDLLILDESLAALDPAMRLRVLAATCRRARALVLIAHAEP